MRALGASDEDIDRIVGEREDPANMLFGVYPMNWQAIEFFKLAETQWHIAIGPMAAVYTGLDYQSVHSVMDIYGVPQEDRMALFEKVRLMEITALPILNQRDEKNG